MKKKHLKIYIVATEQSGDNLASNLMKNLKLNHSYDCSFIGIGGDNMMKEGLSVINHISEFKYIGFFEIIKNLYKILSILDKNYKKIILLKPDLIITIDSPEFSFRLVKRVRKNNIKSKYVHYVAPSVWAWRPWRAKNVAKLYDLLLTIFPFENQYFEKYNLKTVFVGHPIFNEKIDYNVSNENLFLAFLPGSRKGEINSLLPYFEKISEYMYKNSIKYDLFIPTLPHLEKSINKFVKDWKIIPIVTSNKKYINELYKKTKIGIVCSGSAALEVSIKKIPIIVIYKINIFTELLFSFFIKVKFANIINIIKNKEIIPEVINHNLTNKKLINTFKNLLYDIDKQKKQIFEIHQIINTLRLKNNSSFNASLAIAILMGY